MASNRSSVRLRLQLAAVPVSDRVCRTGFVRPKFAASFGVNVSSPAGAAFMRKEIE